MPGEYYFQCFLNVYIHPSIRLPFVRYISRNYIIYRSIIEWPINAVSDVRHRYDRNTYLAHNACLIKVTIRYFNIVWTLRHWSSIYIIKLSLFIFYISIWLRGSVDFQLCNANLLSQRAASTIHSIPCHLCRMHLMWWISWKVQLITVVDVGHTHTYR